MTNLPLEIFLFHLFIFILIGGVLGSFSSAIIYRVHNGVSWIGSRKEGAARSACPQCNHRLKAVDLVPVLSWCIQKGRCRYCTSSISMMYPIVEVLSILGSLAIYFVFGFGVSAVLLLAALPFFEAQMTLIVRWREVSLPLCVIIVFLTLGALALQ